MSWDTVDVLASQALLWSQYIRWAKIMETNILGLEQKVETLINECKRLNGENRTLKSEQNTLLSEKTQLKEKNRLACSRLEKIVEKLQA